MKLKPPEEEEPGCGVRRPSVVGELLVGVRRPSVEERVGMLRVEPWRVAWGERRGDAVEEVEGRDGLEEEDEDLVIGRRIAGMKKSEVLPMAVARVRVDVMAKPLRSAVLGDWDVMIVVVVCKE